MIITIILDLIYYIYFNISFKFDLYLYYLALIFTIFSLYMYFQAFYKQGYLKKENLKISK